MIQVVKELANYTTALPAVMCPGNIKCDFWKISFAYADDPGSSLPNNFLLPWEREKVAAGQMRVVRKAPIPVPGRNSENCLTLLPRRAIP
jgi:hypothetical protein